MTFYVFWLILQNDEVLSCSLHCCHIIIKNKVSFFQFFSVLSLWIIYRSNGKFKHTALFFCSCSAFSYSIKKFCYCERCLPNYEMGVIGVKLCEKNIFRVKVSLPRLPALWVVHGCGNTVFACNAFFEISLAKYLSQFWRKNSMETSGRNLQTFIVESFTSMESFELSPRSLMEISSWKLVQLMKQTYVDTFQQGTDSWELAAYYYYV